MDINRIMIPFGRLRQLGLKNHTSMVLYGIILFHCYHQDVTWISNKTMANEMGLSDRQVQNCLKDLVDHKCITISNEQKANGGTNRIITPLIVASIEYRKANQKDDGMGGFTPL